MQGSFRYPYSALFVFGLIITGVFFVGSNFNSFAGPPTYWITVDEKELSHVTAAASSRGDGFKANILERRGGIAILKLDEIEMLKLSRGMHSEFHKCSGFMSHTSYEQASTAIAESLESSPDTQSITYTINNSEIVEPMTVAAREWQVRQTIQDLSSLPTRHHAQQGGLDGANMILSKWRGMAGARSDITVETYAHFDPAGNQITPQPSIIMTIRGTHQPDEYVIIGGHQDSINPVNGPSSPAPGADDDASGIASITEIIRVITSTNFRPERTVQFMAYAAEEVGLRGSQDIAEQYRTDNINVVGVLQLDMTNFKGASSDITLMTDNTNSAQNQFVRGLLTSYQSTLVVIESICGYGCSDHASWHAKNYPASMPFEAKYPEEYNHALHTANDTLATSGGNANHALKFTKLGITFVGELAKGSFVNPTVPMDAKYDFDGDGKSDISVYRPENGIWHLNMSQNGYTAFPLGNATDQIVPADYDGDGKTDTAVFRNGIWEVIRSTQGYTSFRFGQAGDIPQPEDYDGDGKADPAVFRPSTGRWYTLRSSEGWIEFTFGLNGDKPVAADFDGDRKADAAVYRSGVWHVLCSTAGYNVVQFGLSGDIPVTGDFDGDGKSDRSVYRNGIWYHWGSINGFSAYQFGIASDIPSSADFDGDGKSDAAVYRDGLWYIFSAASGSFRVERFGLSTDKPVEAAYNQ
ncbi:MAG: M20/M25/M40 family metallo-hydrolase [Pyrinomonadaceae bacterium]